jgi:hypothetical protein
VLHQLELFEPAQRWMRVRSLVDDERTFDADCEFKGL